MIQHTTRRYTTMFYERCSFLISSISLCLWIFAAIVPAYGQETDLEALHLPGDRFSVPLPSSSVAVSDDIFSTAINPAGLGMYRGFELAYLRSQIQRSGNVDADTSGDALFVSWRFFGFGVDYVTPEPGIDINRYTFASGFHPVNSLFIGASYGFIDARDPEYDAIDLWDFGLIYRPLRFLSLGTVIQNINRPDFRGQDIPRQYDLGLALRPFGSDRLTISADAHFTQKDNDFSIGQEDFIYRLTAEPIGGLIFTAQVDQAANFGFGVGVNLISHLTLGGHYTQLRKDTDLTVGMGYVRVSSDDYRALIPRPSQSFIEMTWRGDLSEEPMVTGFLDQRQATLFEVLFELKQIRQDPSVSGVIIKLGPIQFGMATAQELRDALEQVRWSGKKVIFFLEDAGTLEYYLASCADLIVLEPSVQMEFLGLMIETTFYKGLLDKVGIEAQFDHAGEYKTFSDVFTRKEMSDAHREVANAILDDLNRQFTTEIASSRRMTPSEVQTQINRGPLTAKDAQAAGLIDELGYESDLKEIVERQTQSSIRLTELKDYINVHPHRYMWADHTLPAIAILYANGTIVTGESQPLSFLNNKTMGSDTLLKALEQVAEDKTIKVVVLRISSGGGSVVASDIIWRAVEKTRQKKPVIVSMGDAAASGGYYIACNADYILADPGSITGSIGVVSGKINLAKLYEMLGLQVDTVKRGEYVDYLSSARGFTPQEWQILKQQIDYTYRGFLQKVADGRQMSLDEVDAIAKGRIWTGSQAKEIGLIDEIGGFFDAIDVAMEKANLDGQIRFVFLPEYKLPPLFTLLRPFVALYPTQPSAKLPEPLFQAISQGQLLMQEPLLYLMPFTFQIR